MKKVFLSFAGTNDAGTLTSGREGAIFTALSGEKFDGAVIFWNENEKINPSFGDIIKHLGKIIPENNLVSSLQFRQVKIKDVTDHNEVYSVLRSVISELDTDSHIQYTASVTSGTPAMQVCWILLGESGEFSPQGGLRLVRVIDPAYTATPVKEVKLDTTLPKIVSMKEELKNLKENLIPQLRLSVKKGRVFAGDKEIGLSPVEFAYYRYFCERRINTQEGEKFSGLSVADAFTKRIIEFHEESFPDLDLNRIELQQILKSGTGLSITTFRGNVSKINKKIDSALNNQFLAGLFRISPEGKRGAMFYGIKAEPEKIRIER